MTQLVTVGSDFCTVHNANYLEHLRATAADAIYLRVLTLLGLKVVGTASRLPTSAWSQIFLIEPWLFGRVVDSPAVNASGAARSYIVWWTAVGFGCRRQRARSVVFDRLAHRRQLAVIVDFFERCLAPPSFRQQPHRPTAAHLHTGAPTLHVVARVFPQSSEHTIAILVMIPLHYGPTGSRRFDDPPDVHLRCSTP
jgi:hypothetical protein